MPGRILRFVFQYSSYLIGVFCVSILGAGLAVGTAHYLFPVLEQDQLGWMFCAVVGLIVLGILINWKPYIDSFDI